MLISVELRYLFNYYFDDQKFKKCNRNTSQLAVYIIVDCIKIQSALVNFKVQMWY